MLTTDEQAFPPRDTVQIREATVSDMEGILQVQMTAPEAAQWPAALYAQHFGAAAQTNASIQIRKVFCAATQGRVIGFVVLSILCVEKAVECELENLAILPEWRGAGVGGRLVQAVQQVCSECGGIRMGVEVRMSNAVAAKLYQRHGFLKVGTRKNYYANPVDDAIVLDWKP